MSEPYSILIVDDEPRNVEILKLKLESEGFSTDTAFDGESALIKFERQRPNMVLLDVMMPGVDGKQICAMLKERSQGFFVPILLITALTTEESIVEGFEAGADDYLKKPINFPELTARIKNFQKIQTLMSKPPALPAELATHEQVKVPAETVLKVLADRMGPGKKLLFQIRAAEGNGYVCTDGARFVYARGEEWSGHEALEKMFGWKAEEIEVISVNRFISNLDLTLDEMLAWWMQQLDMLRTVREKLPPASTFLVRNLKKTPPADMPPAALAILGILERGLYLDEALRRGSLDVISGLQLIVELYYAGYLLRVDAPDDFPAPYVAPLEPASIEELEGIRKAAAKTVAESAASKADFERDAAESKATIEKLQAQLKDAQALEEMFQAEVVEVKGAQARLQSELIETKTEHGRVQLELAEAKAAQAYLQATLAESKAVPERLQSDLQLTQAVKDRLQTEFAAANTLIAQLQSEHSSLKIVHERMLAEGRTHKEENERLALETSGLKKEVAQSTSKVSELGKSLSASQTVREMLQAELDELKAVHAEELRTHSEKTSDNLGQTTEAVEAREALARQSSEIERLTAALAEKERNLTTLQAQMETSQQRVSEVQLELQDVRQEFRSHIDSTAAQKTSLENRIADLQSDAAAHANELKGVRAELQSRRDECDALNKKSVGLSQDLLQLQESTDFAQRQMGEQLQTVQALQAYKKLLEDELKPLRVEMEAKNAELKAAQERWQMAGAADDDDLPADTNLQETYEQSQSEIERLEGELMLALGQLDDLQEAADKKELADAIKIETLTARLAEAESLIKR